MRELLDKIRASDTVQSIERWPDDDDRHYVLRPEELFARAYAQWVGWKSGSPTMKSELNDTLRAASLRQRLRQWPHDEFLPIASAMDRLFERAGWLERR